MAQPKPTTIPAYMKSLPADRRELVQAIRDTINANIDPLFEEGMQYNMPAWFVPHTAYSAGYHCDPTQPLPFASVASQKSHVGIYLFCLYQDSAAHADFVKAWTATGNTLDMGKSCIRVKKLENVPLDVLGRAIKKMKAKSFIASYDAVRPDGPKASGTPARKTSKKTAKKAAAKKVTKKTSKRTSKKTASRKK